MTPRDIRTGDVVTFAGDSRRYTAKVVKRNRYARNAKAFAAMVVWAAAMFGFFWLVVFHRDALLTGLLIGVGTVVFWRLGNWTVDYFEDRP